MFRRLASVSAAVVLAAGLTLGMAGAASAQSAPGIVTADLACGPLVSNLTVNITSGTPDTSYTVSVLGLGTTVTTNALGDAVATIPIPTALLVIDEVTELLPQIIADGETPLVAPVADVCGIL